MPVMTIGTGRALLSGGQAAAVPWYLSGGISAANCIAAYQPKGAASLAASYVNLANPGTYDAAPGVAPTWASGTGWTFNGSTQWLLTGITPASGWSMFVQYTGFGGANYSYFCGEFTADARFFVGHYEVGAWYASGQQVYNVAPSVAAAGNLGIAGQQGYRNGIADGGAIGAWAGVATVAIGIARLLPFASNAAFTAVALAIYDTTLTAPQVAAVSAAMAAL